MVGVCAGGKLHALALATTALGLRVQLFGPGPGPKKCRNAYISISFLAFLVPGLLGPFAGRPGPGSGQDRRGASTTGNTTGLG